MSDWPSRDEAQKILDEWVNDETLVYRDHLVALKALEPQEALPVRRESREVPVLPRLW